MSSILQTTAEDSLKVTLVQVSPPDFPHSAAAFAAAFLAGGINSVAGGGTLVTFPTLLWLGLPSVAANATNTVAIWPGSLGSIWGFRRELARTNPKMRWLVIPSFIGGAIGALLLRSTPPGIFDRLIPFLILFATVLFHCARAHQPPGSGTSANQPTEHRPALQASSCCNWLSVSMAAISELAWGS